MSTASARPRDRFVLGDSWVVASSPPSQDEIQTKNDDTSPEIQTPTRKPPRRPKSNHASDSIATSTSSMSGPELIMPSIYEAPISEASWVAPVVRSKGDQQSNPSLRQRHKAGATQDSPRPRKLVADPNATTKQRTRPPKPNPSIFCFSTPTRKYIRVAVNTLLLATIAHLLVLPEIIQQYQTLCAIEVLSTIYPASCVPPFPQPNNPIYDRSSPPSSRHNTVTSSQARLESLLSATLTELTPLASTLKQSESQLRAVQPELKKVHPGPKHELDLEFDGCWQATRAAARKFESLRADIRSAVDNLVVTADGVAVEQAMVRSVAHDARLSTQMVRREKYLEQLTARMQSKADELASDLAMLDDHLDSIASVLDREARHVSGFSWSGSSSPLRQARNRNKLWRLIDAFRADKVPDETSSSEDESGAVDAMPFLRTFQHAADLHRPVTHAVLTLSSRLQSLQRRKAV